MLKKHEFMFNSNFAYLNCFLQHQLELLQRIKWKKVIERALNLLPIYKLREIPFDVVHCNENCREKSP